MKVQVQVRDKTDPGKEPPTEYNSLTGLQQRILSVVGVITAVLDGMVMLL